MYYKGLKLLLLTIVFSSSKMISQNLNFYFSPGIQIAYSNQLSLSYQLTTGILIRDKYNSPFSPTPAITFGQRYYFDKNTSKFMKKFNYIDYQISVALAGAGIGRIWNNRYGSFRKYKFYAGAFALLSYDYVDFNNDINTNHHLGLFGVIPIPYSEIPDFFMP